MDKWIENGRIYQINIRSLASREPRNAFEAIGESAIRTSSIAYITKNIHFLKNIGVNTLHIMPPFTMGEAGRKGIGSPYAAKDYLNIDPEYGTMAEMKELIREAHKQGFRVIIGMVPNHTSRDHVWVQHHPEYYVKNENGEVIYDLDWSDTAKLDYNHPGLRRAMFNVYDTWASLLGDDGVDGFRVDMAHFINDRSFWDEAIPRLQGKYSRRGLLFLAECYGIDNSVDLFHRGFNASYDDAFYKLMEHYYGTDYEGESRLADAAHPHAATSHSPYYQTFKAGGISAVVQSLLTEYDRVTAGLKEPVYFARYSDNHDEGRGAWRFGLSAVYVWNSLIYCTSHCLPFMLTGEEFGAVNRPSIHNRFGLCDKGRQVWNGDSWYVQEGIEFEGNWFSRGFQARQQLFSHFKTLNALRRDHSVLVSGAMTFIESGEEGPQNGPTVVAFERTQGHDRVRCLFNLGQQPRCVDAHLMQGEVLYGSAEGRIIPAFGWVILKVSAD
ncbi:MAG: hypothetical protein EOL87_09035 [Spartobacteria bacterium]|nr:hypothetical protein [Spartobacteria bacterium]